MANKEFEYHGPIVNGFVMLFIQLLIMAGIVLLIIDASTMAVVTAIVLGILWVIMTCGYVMLEPNESFVLIFFGNYSGTFRSTGYHWINPFMTKRKISLRIRNLDVEPIKVNDKVGNPILIGLVLVWRIKDTYKAVFDLDSQSRGNNVHNLAFQTFVSIQSDAALREVAGKYAYDDENDNEHLLTLRSGGEEINEQLEHKLNERLAMAGMEVVEARINYLAYAPEIAA
uniref:SPFH domain-containing protein n=1 Tax=uncultured Muribaculum sp. TaxID=1918613 RepID=UPI0026773006